VGSGAVAVPTSTSPAAPQSSASHVASLTIGVLEGLAELIDLGNELFEFSPFVLEQQTSDAELAVAIVGGRRLCGWVRCGLTALGAEGMFLLIPRFATQARSRDEPVHNA
jgi:hypothetical protein